MLPVLRVVLQLARAEQQDAKKHASTIDSLRRTRRQRVRCSAEGKRSNNCDARKQRARYWAQRCAYRSSARRRVLKAHPTRPHGRRGSRPQRPSLEASKATRRHAASGQTPTSRAAHAPPPYKRYAMALGAAATGFMALLVIYGSVSLREGVVGVQDSAPGASSYENAQWSKELSKTELKKETDDEVACCP